MQTVEALTEQTEYACLFTTREGTGLAQGVGFSIAVKYNHTECPWGILYPPSVAKGDAWRNAATTIVEDILDKVFDPDIGKVKIKELTDRLLELNKTYPQYQIGSYNGVPAIQIATIDGRRLEVNIDAGGDPVVTELKQNPIPVYSSLDKILDGTYGYSDHRKDTIFDLYGR